MAVSHIMLEAYKKYILVSLILHGKVQQLPKYTSQIVGRFIKVQLQMLFLCWFQTWRPAAAAAAELLVSLCYTRGRSSVTMAFSSFISPSQN